MVEPAGVMDEGARDGFGGCRDGASSSSLDIADDHRDRVTQPLVVFFFGRQQEEGFGRTGPTCAPRGAGRFGEALVGTKISRSCRNIVAHHGVTPWSVSVRRGMIGPRQPHGVECHL